MVEAKADLAWFVQHPHGSFLWTEEEVGNKKIRILGKAQAKLEVCRYLYTRRYGLPRMSVLRQEPEKERETRDI